MDSLCFLRRNDLWVKSQVTYRLRNSFHNNKSTDFHAFLQGSGNTLTDVARDAAFEGSGKRGCCFRARLERTKARRSGAQTGRRSCAEVQAELAHVTQVTALGELTASISSLLDRSLLLLCGFSAFQSPTVVQDVGSILLDFGPSGLRRMA